MTNIPRVGDTAIIGKDKEVVYDIPYEAEHTEKLDSHGYVGTFAVP
jgi:hypothetical protein